MYQWEQFNSMSKNMLDLFTSSFGSSPFGSSIGQSMAGFWLKQMQQMMNPAIHQNAFCQNTFGDWFRLFPGTGVNFDDLAGRPDQVAKNFSKASMDIYEDMSKLFKMPQLGLMRSYQERMNHLMDEFNRFGLEMGKFIGLLVAPMEKAFIELNKSFSNAADQEDIGDDPQYLYKQWIKILEKHYQQMLNSPEFIQALHALLFRYSIFNELYHGVSTDFLKFTPVSSKKDLDELAKENYSLRRELRKTNKRIDVLENQMKELLDVHQEHHNS